MKKFLVELRLRNSFRASGMYAVGRFEDGRGPK